VQELDCFDQDNGPGKIITNRKKATKAHRSGNNYFFTLDLFMNKKMVSSYKLFFKT
jgi:hypothetical protein